MKKAAQLIWSLWCICVTYVMLAAAGTLCFLLTLGSKTGAREFIAACRDISTQKLPSWDEGSK